MLNCPPSRIHNVNSNTESTITTFTEAQIRALSSDNIAVTNVNIVPLTFEVSGLNLGPKEVMITIGDAAGNEDMCRIQIDVRGKHKILFWNIIYFSCYFFFVVN